MIITILRDLFINACILITIVFIGSQFFMDIGLGSSAPLKVKIQSGIMGALLGIILIIFSIKIPPYSLIDLRNISIVIIAIYGGGISTFITGILVAFFRLFYQGISSTSIIAAGTLLILTTGCIFVSKANIKRIKKWIYTFIFSGIITSIGFTLTIENQEILSYFLISYWIGSLLATILVYFLTAHLVKTHLLLKVLKEESTIDFLTGLKNTRSFDILFTSILEQAATSGGKISLLMLDIDFFKKVNDTYGHAAGDIILRELGELLSKSIRDFDMVARIGGEEFCMVLRDCPCFEALEIAERIRKTVENHAFYLSSDNKTNITISIGCAMYPDTVMNLERIKEAADMKLYEAKRTGRNKVCV